MRLGRLHWALLGASLLVTLGMPGTLPAQDTSRAEVQPDDRRIVAIGDIHGAIEPLRTILRETRLMDGSGRWTGGEAVLVQTGDFLDRGAGTFEVVELLRSLQQQAPEAGGEVLILMGNHEAINLLRDMRYVDKELLAPWTTRKSEKVRRRHCEKALDLEQRRSAFQDTAGPEPKAFRETCEADTPLGLVEYLEELEPDADLGRWLRTLPATAEVGGVLFVHGGLTEQTAALDLDVINRQAANEVEIFDRVRAWLVSRSLVLPTAAPTTVAGAALQVLETMEAGTKIFEAPATEDLAAFRNLREWYLIDPDGPLWFRGYARWGGKDGSTRIRTILKLAGARAVVSGHTPQETATIQRRWGGRVYLIDTGMLESHYGGKPSALEILGSQVSAVYPGLREVFDDGDQN